MGALKAVEQGSRMSLFCPTHTSVARVLGEGGGELYKINWCLRTETVGPFTFGPLTEKI